jgi:hypothetical protein
VTRSRCCCSAGSDGRSKGACPFCQDVFLKLLLKRQAANEFSFDVITINCKNPPKEFKEISKKLPTLVHGDIILNDIDEIEDYLDSSFQYLTLAVRDTEAFRIQSNVFQRFTYLIKDVTNNPQPLYDELEKIDAFLKQRGTTYISGNNITGMSMTLNTNGKICCQLGLDCTLWPKLQHIRVAADYIRQVSIPMKFTALWRYLGSSTYSCI